MALGFHVELQFNLYDTNNLDNKKLNVQAKYDAIRESGLFRKRRMCLHIMEKQLFYSTNINKYVIILSAIHSETIILNMFYEIK